MRGFGLLLAVAVIGGVAWLDYQDGEFLNGFGNATSTVSFGWGDDEKEEDEEEAPRSGGSRRSSGSGASPSTLSPEDAEKQVAEVYEELDKLEEDVRGLELIEPRSPYYGLITMKAGGAKDTDPQKEHVIITAEAGNISPITVTGWTLESYVTRSEAEIPEGARLLKSHTSRSEEPIALRPGERAYLISGETPLRVSFRENMCTGYLHEHEDFSPSLKKNCPLPQDELLGYTGVKASDSKCAEFVDDIKRCEIIDEDEVDEANLSGSCESFINGVLDYEGCVARHDDDLTFFATGDWRIYLEADRELWRSTREIIRLLDQDGKVVAVVEY